MERDYLKEQVIEDGRKAVVVLTLLLDSIPALGIALYFWEKAFDPNRKPPLPMIGCFLAVLVAGGWLWFKMPRLIKRRTIESYSLPYEIRGHRGCYIFPLLFVGYLSFLLALFARQSLLYGAPPNVWQCFAFLASLIVLTGLATWGFSTQRIVLLEDRMIVHDVTARFEIFYSDIQRAEIAGSRRSWGILLSGEGRLQKPLGINGGLFDSKDLAVILDVIAHKTTGKVLALNAESFRRNWFSPLP